MNNIGAYMGEIANFRKELRTIGEKYRPEYDRLERYRDSAGYADEKAAVDSRRKAEEGALRTRYGAMLSTRVADMERAYSRRPKTTVAPTSEQLNILQTLKIREHLTLDELRQAAASMAGCPLAERTVADIAKGHGFIIPTSGTPTDMDMEGFFRSLRKNSHAFVSDLDAYKKGSDYLAQPRNGHESRVDLFRMDRDNLSGSDIIGRFGSFSGSYEALCGLVND